VISVADRAKLCNCDWIDIEDPEVCELLEQLDDLVFDALSGCDDARAQVDKLWPIAGIVLGDELLDDSREQYLRRASEVLEQFDQSGPHGPQQAVAALNIVRLLSTN
jgi:hypothetical protein